MTKEIWKYGNENIKRRINAKDEHIMAVNISYPVFSDGAKGIGKKGFILKINKFYCHTAEKYANYISTKYPAKAAKTYKANGGIKLSFLMTCTVSYNRESLVSIFSDLSYFDGMIKRNVRFSQNWSPEKSAILPARYVFDTSAKSKKYIHEIITGIAETNMSGTDFSYYGDFEKIIRRKFDFDNFYFVPNGVAFFYNAGVLSNSLHPEVFVIPLEKIDGILKVSLS